MKKARIEDIVKSEQKLISHSYQILQDVGVSDVIEGHRQYQKLYNNIKGIHSLLDLEGKYEINKLEREHFVLNTIINDYLM